jgi:hypothetical protein
MKEQQRAAAVNDHKRSQLDNLRLGKKWHVLRRCHQLPTTRTPWDPSDEVQDPKLWRHFTLWILLDLVQFGVEAPVFREHASVYL